MTRASRADLLAAALIVAVTFVLYRGVLGLFWIHDSPFHLRLLAEHGLSDFLFSSDFWRLEKSVFTPLLFLSLAVDRAVAGLSPTFSYAHQLAAVALAAIALYGLLRLWAPVSCAAAGSLLFLLGPAVAATAPVLMVRHYFEALALGCASALAFVLAVRRGSRGWAIASAFLLLLALSAKEIVAPLPFLLALAPEGELRQRLRALVAHLGALVAYGSWRIALLDEPVSGHGFVHPDGLAGLVTALPAKIPSPLVGASSPLAVGIVLLLALAVLALRPRSLVVALAGFVAGLLPIVPVSFEMQPRLLLACWMVLAGLVSVAWWSLAQRSALRRAAPWLAGLTLLAVAVAGRATWGVELAKSVRQSAEARSFMELGNRGILRHPENASPTLAELGGLRARPSGEGAAAGWYQDDIYLCVTPLSGRTVWELDRGALELREVTGETFDGAGARCRSLCRREPLTGQFFWNDRDLHWQLGPHPDGEYSFVLENGKSRIAVPRRAGFRLGSRELALRLRYESPQGWVTYSPELALRYGHPLDWSRPAGTEQGPPFDCPSS